MQLGLTEEIKVWGVVPCFVYDNDSLIAELIKKN